MDTERMLALCRRDQWTIDELDWSVTPRVLSRAHEEAVCQYFTDMAGIERLAGALFAVQRDQARDDTLRAIFATFVVDEERHAEVALRLARHYDVHGYRRYATNPHLVRFSRHFVEAARTAPPDIANAYITTGELLLDIALLRSLDEFVDDDMSHAAMRLINRDESRHIAVDYHMAEYYASAEYDAWMSAQPRKGLRAQVRSTLALAGFLRHAQPFFRDVFFRPMALVDPSGTRLIDAFKRVQLLGRKQGTGPRRPFTRFVQTLQALFENPLTRPLFGRLVERVLGVDPRVIHTLYTPDELAHTQRVSFEALAAEALALKLA
jgi:hypothetical protein